MERLSELKAGTPIPYGGDKVTCVPVALAEAFKAGDRLLVVQETGDLLHVPAAVHEIAAAAVGRAADAFAQMAAIDDAQVTAFFDAFARLLESDAVWRPIAEANAQDVRLAKAKGRSTTRLAVDARMRKGMVEGLREWAAAKSPRGRVIEKVRHRGWS